MASHVNVFGSWLMLVSSGLWSGGILIFAVERTNLWSRMPVAQYAVDFRRSLYRVDPLLPVLGGVGGAGAVAFAVTSGGRSALLAWVGCGLIVMVILASVVIAEPINSKFRRVAEWQVPADVERYRMRWCRFHAVRNVIALAAFGCLAAAVV